MIIYIITSLDANGEYNFGNQTAIRVLNEVLAHKYFGLSLCIPPLFLCPTIANRLDYLLHVQDLLKDVPGPINAIDMYIMYLTVLIFVNFSGCGAACIYPLLACKIRSDWNFIATEIDPTSLQHARDNVRRNGLDDRITLFPISDRSQDLLSPLLTPPFNEKTFHLVVCNPPFYHSKQDIEERREAKKIASVSSLEYTENESIYPGGEVAFITRIIRESCILKDRCLWYTSLVGFKSSLPGLENVLISQKIGASNYRIFTSTVGSTKRWILAWTFSRTGRVQKRKAIDAQCAEIILKQPPRLGVIISLFDSLQICQYDDYFLAELQTWGRKARRSGVVMPLNTPLKFRMNISGCALQLHLMEGEWEILVSLLNYTKTMLQAEHNESTII